MESRRDEVANGDDNCPEAANPDQADLDEDEAGDACDGDLDGDGLENEIDTCPEVANPGAGQADLDEDGRGDVCDDDRDGDGVADDQDNCPLVANPDQLNTDRDYVTPAEGFVEPESPTVSDERGDACDDDDDGDGKIDAEDNCALVPNRHQADFDLDGLGDACDDDMDDDGVRNGGDNCPRALNADQQDSDRDGVGDRCQEYDSLAEKLRVEGRSTGSCFCSSGDAPASPGAFGLLILLLGARLRTQRRR